MPWKNDERNEWIYIPSQKEHATIYEKSQPFVLFISLRDPSIDYFSTHPPTNRMSGDYDYTKKGYQLVFGKFAGFNIHFGFFRKLINARKRAKTFIRRYDSLAKLRKIRARYSFE